MATEKQKWQKLPWDWRRKRGLFGLGNFRENLTIAQVVGFVWDDSRENWYILVDGTKYWVGDKNIDGKYFTDPYRQLGDKNPDNDPIYVFNSTGKSITKKGTYELRQDDKGAWFYYDDSGKKLYQDATYSGDAQAQVFIGNSILTAPTYNFSDKTLKDILGNPILPKPAEVGLYDTKTYLDSIDRKRAVYRKFYDSKIQAEKINSINLRATDIITEQNNLIYDLNRAGANISRENSIINLFLSAFSFGASKDIDKTKKAAEAKTAAEAKASGSRLGLGIAVFGLVKKYAASKTTGRREKLRSEDLMYLEDELNAIKAYINKSSRTMSSDSGDSGVGTKNNYWIIGGAVLVLIIMTYLFLRKK